MSGLILVLTAICQKNYLHMLAVCVCVCVCVLVTQSSLSLTQWTVALRTPVHGISQPRILETLAILFSRVFSQTRDQTQVSWITAGFFIRVTREAWTKLPQFSSVQTLSHVQLFVNSLTAAPQTSCPSPTPRASSNSYPLSVMPSKHLIFCHPLLFLPLTFPSIRVFSNESVLPGGQSTGASTWASVLPVSIRVDFL